jgi:hypothetical protein
MKCHEDREPYCTTVILLQKTKKKAKSAKLPTLDCGRYDLTHTLQHNMSVEHTFPPKYNDKYVWNRYLLEPLLARLQSPKWTLPVIHGYYRQAGAKEHEYIFLSFEIFQNMNRLLDTSSKCSFSYLL